MIVGIGTDLCDIRRIADLLEKFPGRFEARIYTPAERDRARRFKDPAAYFAKRFAAKEAVAKSLAGPRTGPLSWLDVETLNDQSGRPKVNLYRGAKKRAKMRAGDAPFTLHISLTDDYPYAQAFAIFETL